MKHMASQAGPLGGLDGRQPTEADAKETPTTKGSPMPTKAIVAAPADEPGQGFDTHHPLADVVSRLHRAHGGKPFTGIGRIGCAGCWETAIRNDERVAVEFDLPALQIDPDYVDEVAVEQACTGQRPALTVQERAVALARLLDAGLTRSQVARRRVPLGFRPGRRAGSAGCRATRGRSRVPEAVSAAR